MEYIVPSLRIAAITKMTDIGTIEERLAQFVQMEEDRFIAGFHQNVEKQRQKSWHDRHITTKQFKVGGLVMMYDSKFLKHLGKLKTHWLGPYVVVHITEVGTVKLHKLDGTPVAGMINGSQLKPYLDDCDTVLQSHDVQEKGDFSRQLAKSDKQLEGTDSR